MNHLIKFALYASKRKAYDLAHAASAKAWKEMADAERELIDSMLTENVASFESTAEGRYKVSMRKNFAIAVNKDNEFLVRKWIEDTEGDIKLFTKEELNKSAITQLIKQKVADGQLDEHEVPEFFKLKASPSLMVRGWEKSGENFDEVEF
jgi:hypothetical protein